MKGSEYQKPGENRERVVTLTLAGHSAREVAEMLGISRARVYQLRQLADGSSLKRTAAGRFWVKVQKTEACWIWNGYVSEEGYGKFFPDQTKAMKAHRFAYELLVGPIPEGLTIDHLCRNRRCVNPSHLEPVTGRENTLRGSSPSAENARKTHCKHGHLLDEANVRLSIRDGSAKRTCRKCDVIRSQKSYAKKKSRLSAN